MKLPLPVYLMTDEKSPRYFYQLKKHINFITYRNYPFLEKIIKEEHPDNFLLFAIEKEIFRNARRRIATFTDSSAETLSLSPYSMHHVNTSFYQTLNHRVGDILRRMKRRLRGLFTFAFRNNR
jgi:hypothetical protein